MKLLHLVAKCPNYKFQIKFLIIKAHKSSLPKVLNRHYAHIHNPHREQHDMFFHVIVVKHPPPPVSTITKQLYVQECAAPTPSLLARTGNSIID